MTHEAEWIEWAGGKCPVDDDALVEVRFRDDAVPEKGVRIEWPVRAWELAWYHDGKDDDIIAYRVLPPVSA